METTEFISQYGWLAPQVSFICRKPIISLPPTKATNRAPPFLGLPVRKPEIRHRIYEHILRVNVSPQEPWVKVSQDRALARKRVGRLIFAAAGNKYSVLAILETCRQVFVEAWHLYYRQNMLCLEDAAHLFRFLRDIGVARRNQIVAIRCDFDLGAFDRSISDMPTRPREVNPEETVEWWLHKNKSWYEHQEPDIKAEILKRLETILKRTRSITPQSLIEGERMRDQGWDNDSEDDDEMDMLRNLCEDENQEEWVEVVGHADGMSAG